MGALGGGAVAEEPDVGLLLAALGDGITDPMLPHAPKRSVAAPERSVGDPSAPAMLLPHAMRDDGGTSTQRRTPLRSRRWTGHAGSHLARLRDQVAEILRAVVLRDVPRNNKLVGVEPRRNVIGLPPARRTGGTRHKATGGGTTAGRQDAATTRITTHVVVASVRALRLVATTLVATLLRLVATTAAVRVAVLALLLRLRVRVAVLALLLRLRVRVAVLALLLRLLRIRVHRLRVLLAAVPSWRLIARVRLSRAA